MTHLNLNILIATFLLSSICFFTCYGEETSEKGADVPPQISWISPNQTKNVGDSVQLECVVQDANNWPVLWLRLSNETGISHLIISSDSTLIIRDQTFSIEYNKYKSSYKLEIKELKEEEAGIYQCQILMGVKSKARVTANVHLLIWESSERSTSTDMSSSSTSTQQPDNGTLSDEAAVESTTFTS